MTNKKTNAVCPKGVSDCRSPFSDFSSDPEPELDWLPVEGGARRILSSSLLGVASPPSELLRESLRADREEDVLFVSLRGLRDRPVDGGKHAP